jgi:glutathione S-transferase
MCEAVILVRYETSVRPESLRWSDWIDDQWDKIWAGLAWFEASPSALELPINIAQIALGCALGYIGFRYPERQYRDRFPTVANWFTEIGKRPAFKLTVPVPAP